jgi:hypothetical protein
MENYGMDAAGRRASKFSRTPWSPIETTANNDRNSKGIERTREEGNKKRTWEPELDWVDPKQLPGLGAHPGQRSDPRRWERRGGD